MNLDFIRKLLLDGLRDSALREHEVQLQMIVVAEGIRQDIVLTI